MTLGFMTAINIDGREPLEKEQTIGLFGKTPLGKNRRNESNNTI